jgi:outer membrane protein TolC
VDELLRLQRDGRADQLGVLDAERTLASTELSLAQLRTGISADQIAIFLALGGGWQASGSNARMLEQ